MKAGSQNKTDERGSTQEAKPAWKNSSPGIVECTCMVFTFENGVLLMR